MWAIFLPLTFMTGSSALNLDKSGTFLLLIFSVLLTAKLVGKSYGFVATIVAGLLLAYILPPDNSLWINAREDRLALVLFLVTTLAATGLMSWESRSAT